MKCPRCGADSSVLATRAWLAIFVKRSRECFNGHRFASFEVTEGLVNKGHLPRRLEAHGRHVHRNKSRAFIARHADLPATKLAEMTGYSAEHIRSIRTGRR